MRIGINGVSVVAGGNISYFANLLPQLAKLLEDTGDQLIVYTRKAGPVKVPNHPSLVEECVAPEGLVGGRRIAWEQSRFPYYIRRDRLDVFYGPTDNVPLLANTRFVCAYRNPNIYIPIMSIEPAVERPRNALLRMMALATARRIERAIFVSGASRDDIVPVIHLNPAKARVVHHGIGTVFKEALVGDHPWNGRPYLLTISMQYKYKNSPRLIEAFAKYIKGRGMPHGLVIIGGMAEQGVGEDIQAAIDRCGVRDDVLVPGLVKYPGAGRWFKHASTFVFPSYRETFGHPLLEGMMASLPVAAADIPVMREIGGDVPVYFDPFSVDALGNALLDVLDDTKRADRVARGNARVGEFTWERTARETLAIIREAAAAR